MLNLCYKRKGRYLPWTITRLFLPTNDDVIEWLLILLSLVSIGEAGGLSYNDAAAEDVDEVTLPPVFGCGGETICPLNIVAEFWCTKPGRTKAAALVGPRAFE